MIAIVLQSMRNRWFSISLSTVAIALAIALAFGINRARDAARAGFDATINGVDLIVGARGGDVQILLYSVFNIGNATNNISAETLSKLEADPGIAWVAPMWLGDSHRGYRVVGTDHRFFEHVQTGGGKPLTYADGQGLTGIFGAVIGSTVARDLDYQVGQSMVVTHGMVSAGTADHDDMPFYVAGILAPTGTPIDRNVYVPLEGITAIHIDWKNGAKIPGASTSVDQLESRDLSPSSLTAALIGVENRRRIFQIQRRLNDDKAEPLSAIIPGVALSNLWAVMGVVEESFRFISLSAFAVSILGLVALLNMSLAQRRREMAIYRSLGARPWQIASLLLIEASLIGVVAAIVGIVLTLTLQQLVAQFAFTHASIALQFAPLSSQDLLRMATYILATLLAGILPAFRLYRQSLVDGITVTE